VKKRSIAFLVCLFCLPVNLLAWGNKGHIVVAQVAKNQLTQNIIDSVEFYLNGMRWEEAATWVTDMRKQGQLEYTFTWHSIIVPRDKTYVKTEQPNLMNRIEYFLAVIKSRALFSRQDVASALKVLIHLVGDLHEPLNCGYPEDKGGKRTQVEFMGRMVSLYKVWESEIIEEREVDQWDGARINLAMSRNEIAQIKYGSTTDWFDESRQLLTQVYDFNGTFITTEYINKSRTLIAKQLVKGGMRLAYLLNSCFKVGSRATF